MSNYLQLSITKKKRELLTECLISLCKSFSNCEIDYPQFKYLLHELMDTYRKETYINV